MLGLGDIVIPGVFISLAARFDYTQAIMKTLKSGKIGEIPNVKTRHSKPYFYSVLASYIAGLVT